jgi:hypothetical protein
VRLANRSACIAEQALQEQRRPVLVHARLDDPPQKVRFADKDWIQAEGGETVIEEYGDTIYLGMTLRNVGAGIAVLQGWHTWGELAGRELDHRDPADFRLQIRDIYVALGDVDMWQGALHPSDGLIFGDVAAVCAERRPFEIDLLYGDQIGGQRTVTRFSVTPVGDDRWLGSVGIHWNLDLAGPR